MSPAKRPKTPIPPTSQDQGGLRSPISKASLHQDPGAQLVKVFRKALEKESPSERTKWESLLNDLEALPQATERDNRALQGFREWKTNKEPKDFLNVREGEK